MAMRQHPYSRPIALLLWSIIAIASQAFSGIESERLAGLFIAIKNLPDVTNKHGYVFKSSGGVVWRDLPDWAWIYWERGLGWQYDMYAHTEEDKQRWFEQAPGKLKSTTFAANVLARTGSETCMWSFASQMIEEAVASYDTTIEKEVRDCKEVIIRGSDREMEGEWKMYIPPAVEWILVAGERLYEYSFCEAPEDSMKFNTRTPKAGDRIFSKDRWGFWKKRFRELIAWKEVDEHCRELMERALKKMDVLEAEEEQRLR